MNQADKFWQWFGEFEAPYKPLMAELSKAFGAEFSMWHTGGGNMALTANLEGAFGLLITEADDVLGRWEDRTETTGYAVGCYRLEQSDCGCWQDANGKPIKEPCDHGPYLDMGDQIGWASSPAANSTDRLVKLIRLALASVTDNPVGLGAHIDPALLVEDAK